MWTYFTFIIYHWAYFMFLFKNKKKINVIQKILHACRNAICSREKQPGIFLYKNGGH